MNLGGGPASERVIGHVVSVNVGRPRQVRWHDRTVTTGIWKQPVDRRLRAANVNLDGDDQADRRVHGGPTKAIYAYSSEDYEWWANELGSPIAPGTFGENLTIAGIDPATAVIGEIWRIGTTTLRVTEPRIPCFKLGIRMGDAAFVDRFADAARPGTYLAIDAPGRIGAGDAISRVTAPATGSRSAPLSAPTTGTTSSCRSSSTWRSSPKVGAAGPLAAYRATYELTDETRRSALLMTRSARKSSQDITPTARSGARMAPARNGAGSLARERDRQHEPVLAVEPAGSRAADRPSCARAGRPCPAPARTARPSVSSTSRAATSSVSTGWNRKPRRDRHDRQLRHALRHLQEQVMELGSTQRRPRQAGVGDDPLRRPACTRSSRTSFGRWRLPAVSGRRR